MYRCAMHEAFSSEERALARAVYDALKYGSSDAMIEEWPDDMQDDEEISIDAHVKFLLVARYLLAKTRRT